jgi:hypothetical protein
VAVLQAVQVVPVGPRSAPVDRQRPDAVLVSRPVLPGCVEA